MQNFPLNSRDAFKKIAWAASAMMVGNRLVPTISGSTVLTAAVSIGPRDIGGFGLAVKLLIEDPSLPQAELAALATEAHEKICPYSNATRNNIDVQLEIKGA